MKHGLCKLCLQEKDLCLSHYLSKGLHRILRDSRAKNPNPFLITHTTAFQTSRQVTDTVLCSACEQLLNKKGEAYTIRQMSNKGSFPLMDAVKRMTPKISKPDVAGYTCAGNPEIDTEALAHFALGLLWKAGAHPWRSVGGIMTDIHLGPYQEILRKYCS